MAEMAVDLVAVDRKVWSGRATFVFARTIEGEIGILPHHIPLMAELVAAGAVRIDTVDSGSLSYAVDGGFLSVNKEGVVILAEDAIRRRRDRRESGRAGRGLRGRGSSRARPSEAARPGPHGLTRRRDWRAVQAGMIVLFVLAVLLAALVAVLCIG